MVMPFRRRKVEGAIPGAPSEVDCDALWDRVYRPTLLNLGYLPVRADADTGTVIVKDMLERLAHAHLVLADVTFPNGNVYYEIGLRHVARNTGCVLVAADWSRQLFDIDQFRTIRFPLVDGAVPAADATEIQELLCKQIVKMQDSVTPWHELIVPSSQSDAPFRDQMEALAQFQASTQAARIAPKIQRADIVKVLVTNTGASTLSIPEVACELVCLLRDEVGWQAEIDFIASLPPNTRALPFIREQQLLALAETGKPLDAIGQLEALISQQGDSAERQGLIGGRYKRLWKAAKTEREARNEERPSSDERRYLNKAIEHYARGMEFDLNLYYCSSNLPALLQARGAQDDIAQAASIESLVVAACARALKRRVNDEWLRPTLLCAAFRAQDVVKAAELADQVEDEGTAAWKLKSVLNDLDVAVQQVKDPVVRAALHGIYERLKKLDEENTK
jgi:hypothetical protein